MQVNGPWSFDRGQLRDKDGNALASFPIHPNGLGGSEDSRNGELCALLPTLIDTLTQLVERCEQMPLPGYEGLRGPLLSDAKTLLLKIGVKTARIAPGGTTQGWLSYRGVPVVIVVDAAHGGTLTDVCNVLIAASRARGPD